MRDERDRRDKFVSLASVVGTHRPSLERQLSGGGDARFAPAHGKWPNAVQDELCFSSTCSSSAGYSSSTCRVPSLVSRAKWSSFEPKTSRIPAEFRSVAQVARFDGEDHTIGQMMREQLLLLPGVREVGLLVDDEDDVFLDLRIHTEPDYAPRQALRDAASSLSNVLAELHAAVNAATGFSSSHCSATGLSSSHCSSRADTSCSGSSSGLDVHLAAWHAGCRNVNADIEQDVMDCLEHSRATDAKDAKDAKDAFHAAVSIRGAGAGALPTPNSRRQSEAARTTHDDIDIDLDNDDGSEPLRASSSALGGCGDTGEFNDHDGLDGLDGLGGLGGLGVLGGPEHEVVTTHDSGNGGSNGGGIGANASGAEARNDGCADKVLTQQQKPPNAFGLLPMRCFICLKSLSNWSETWEAWLRQRVELCISDEELACRQDAVLRSMDMTRDCCRCAFLTQPVVVLPHLPLRPATTPVASERSVEGATRTQSCCGTACITVDQQT